MAEKTGFLSTQVSIWRLERPTTTAQPRKQATNCHEEPSFLEEQTVFLEEGTQIIGTVTKAVMGVALKPLTDQFIEMVGTDTESEFPQVSGLIERWK